MTSPPLSKGITRHDAIGDHVAGVTITCDRGRGLLLGRRPVMERLWQPKKKIGAK